MFNKNIDGLRTGWVAAISIFILLSCIFLATSRSLTTGWLEFFASLCFILVLCIWITLGWQRYERRLQERAEKIAESKRVEEP